MDKNAERRDILKKAGYFTLDSLIQRLQELKEKGHGDKMVAGMNGHFQFCDYDNNDDEILIC